MTAITCAPLAEKLRQRHQTSSSLAPFTSSLRLRALNTFDRRQDEFGGGSDFGSSSDFSGSDADLLSLDDIPVVDDTPVDNTPQTSPETTPETIPETTPQTTPETTPQTTTAENTIPENTTPDTTVAAITTPDNQTPQTEGSSGTDSQSATDLLSNLSGVTSTDGTPISQPGLAALGEQVDNIVNTKDSGQASQLVDKIHEAQNEAANPGSGQHIFFYDNY